MTLDIAVVGLNFGAEFIDIYRDHPEVGEVAICDANAETLALVGDRAGVERRYADLDALLADPGIDAVHLCTPFPSHGDLAIRVLEAGKHCASAVPAAVEVGQLREIVRLESASGRNYMMMETAVYSREFLHVKDLVERGEFGTLTFGRGAHHQSMDDMPPYWQGVPPHWYTTHAISPLLALLDTRATTVRALGSGRLPGWRQERWGNPFPFETSIYELEDSDVAVEVSRSMHQTARTMTETFSLYGERMSFEDGSFFSTPADETGVVREELRSPDRADLLPEPIRHHTRTGYSNLAGTGFLFKGGGHGGSHPHLVHEFVSSIAEGRRPWIDAVRAADWSAAGIAAHESALRGGAVVEVPSFGPHP